VRDDYGEYGRRRVEDRGEAALELRLAPGQQRERDDSVERRKQVERRRLPAEPRRGYAGQRRGEPQQLQRSLPAPQQS